MKKHYTRIAVVVELLVLLVFLLGSVLYAYILAAKELKFHMDQVKTTAEFNVPKPKEGYTEADFIKDSFTSCWDFFQTFRTKETGFYGFVRMKDGTEFDTSRPYAYVYRYNDGFIENEEIRIFLIDGNFSESYDQPTLYNPVFDAECDDVFIHGGTMDLMNHTYQLGDYAYEVGDRVSVSDWAGESALYGEYITFAKNKHEEKLNKEAQALFEELYNSNSTVFTRENIFTSYRLSQVGTTYGNYYMIQVFHPLSIAIMSHIGAFIAILASFLFTEILVAFIFRKLYKNRMEYEAKSKRLTRGIAHELKTPLAVTRAYMENLDCIDEEDRPEYAEKINREVEDMSNMINVLLEMEKIDDGTIRLNPEEVELSSLIQSVYNRIKPLAEERSLNITLPDENEYLIKADLKLIKIALGNYLTNMVKYADKEGKVSIESAGKKYRVTFINDSSNDSKAKTDKLSNNGMGVEINENIMKLHNFKCGSYMGVYSTEFWFEADKA